MYRSLTCGCVTVSLLAGLAWPLAVAAAPAPISAAQADCNEQAVGMDGLAACAEAELARQHARMQAGLRQLEGRLPAGRAAELQQSQAHWLQWQQRHCQLASDPDSGSLVPMQQLQCHITQTTRRADELSRLHPRD